MDDETLLKKYPRMIPKRGIDPNDGDPKNHVVANTPAEHQKANPEDFAVMLAEVPTAVGGNVAAAVEQERERCAQIAEGTGGKYGKQIAAEIRGVQPPPED